jgi:hypothetical protein
MLNWLSRQYDDIRGNFKWFLLLSLWALISHFTRKMLELIPHISTWIVWTIIVLLSLAAFVWVAKWDKSTQSQSSSQPPAPLPTTSQPPVQLPTTTPGVPTLSNLLGQTPQIPFDAKDFFKRAYYSPVTAELENNIKVIAHRESNPEDFYARFIGVGLPTFMYEIAWASMFKSQFLALSELNRQILLPSSEVKKFYDNAVSVCPKVYLEYPFEKWLAYLIFHQLVIKHPSEMVELTHKGRDFLKYLAHHGYNPDLKTC